MSDFEGPREQYKSSTVSFLLTELETGIIFADIAAASNDQDTKLSNVRNARKAYATVIRFLPTIALSPSEKEQISVSLSALRSALERVGSIY
jgi:hypothetical protein